MRYCFFWGFYYYLFIFRRQPLLGTSRVPRTGRRESSTRWTSTRMEKWPGVHRRKHILQKLFLWSLVEGFQSYPHLFKARVCSMLRQRSEDGRPALPPVQNIAAYQFHKLKYSQIFPNIPENLCKLSFLKYIQIKALIGSSGRNIASRNLPLRERGPEDPDISWSTTRIEIENYSAALKFEVHNMCITHSNFSIIIYISYIYSIVVLFYINCSKSTFS